jgi:hypothetical protein
MATIFLLDAAATMDHKLEQQEADELYCHDVGLYMLPHPY